MCRERGERAVPNATALVLVALLMLAAGCSDDVVCPEPSPDMVPFVSARVFESDDSGGTATAASVFCTADPLPDYLVASISGRQINTVGTATEPGILRTMEDELVVWQPGTQCSLRVTTNYGFATSSAVVPSSPEVTTTASMSLGDSLRLDWRKVPSADYYRVVLEAPAASGGNYELTATTRETAHVFEAADFISTGTASGYVDAVAGPFREAGSDGNVTGQGWGFFNLNYHDASGTFSVEIAE